MKEIKIYIMKSGLKICIFVTANIETLINQHFQGYVYPETRCNTMCNLY